MSDTVLRAPTKKVFISQERINTSVERDSAHCMFADAIKDSIPSAQRPEVDIQTVRWSDPEAGYRYVYLTPRAVQDAIIHFDTGEKNKLKPFTFTLPSKEAQMFPLCTLTEEQKASKRKYNESYKEREIVVGKVNGQGREDVVGVIGGTPPPRVPGGRRRIFVLKQMRA